MSGSAGVGILVVQLGTPDEPTTPALRRYLAEFLSDRRVVDLPRAVWLPILHLRVLRTRPQRSARLYAKIWTPEGSPLAVTTHRQAALLRQELAGAGAPLPVVVAMRYGKPSIEEALEELRTVADRFLVVPMYPQYAGASTGSSLERVHALVAGWPQVPAVRTVPPYFADPHYLDALADVASRSLAGCEWRPDRYIVSFHGLPQRYADRGDPYPQHCERTAQGLAERLDWPRERVVLAYQSRGEREVWLKPNTDEILVDLGRQQARVAVICPGFVADCLETLEEINITNRERFIEAGGRDFHYIPCLNDAPAWGRGLAAIVRRELGGWM
jgi:ferrochelatase